MCRLAIWIFSVYSGLFLLVSTLDYRDMEDHSIFNAGKPKKQKRRLSILTRKKKSEIERINYLSKLEFFKLLLYALKVNSSIKIVFFYILNRYLTNFFLFSFFMIPPCQEREELQ